MKKVKIFDDENKFDLFLLGEIEGFESGDWNDEEEDEYYELDLREIEWMDMDFSLSSLCKYIGKGKKFKCNEEDEFIYNIIIDDYVLIVKNSFLYLNCK